MRKSIVSVVLLLGAGVALGAVSQRVLVTRAASAECAGIRCPPASSDRSTSAIPVAEVATPRSHAIAETGNAGLLASKPMPGQLPELPQPEPSPSAWITPFRFNETIDITPLGQDVVVKTLALPAGQYTLLATLDAMTHISGFCLLQGKAASTSFYDDLDTAGISGREIPAWSPSNEIQVRQRVALQGVVSFGGSGGEVRVVCKSFFDSAYTSLQMEVQRPVLSAQLQRAIVLAPP